MIPVHRIPQQSFYRRAELQKHPPFVRIIRVHVNRITLVRSLPGPLRYQFPLPVVLSVRNEPTPRPSLGEYTTIAVILRDQTSGKPELLRDLIPAGAEDVFRLDVRWIALSEWKAISTLRDLAALLLPSVMSVSSVSLAGDRSKPAVSHYYVNLTD